MVFVGYLFAKDDPGTIVDLQSVPLLGCNPRLINFVVGIFAKIRNQRKFCFPQTAQIFAFNQAYYALHT
jgi:hypothetical protein